MISLFRKLWKNKRGNAIVIAGASLPMIVGAAGLASDTIQWTLWKRQLQRAADSAAIAGVYDRQSANGATTTVAATVAHDVSVNLHTWFGVKTGYPKVDFPANSGVMTNQVHVTLAIQKPLPFSSMFMTAAPTIVANATAASIPGPGDPCMLATTDDPKDTGLTYSGDADIEMPDCPLFSNSPSKNSAIAKGSSHVHASSVAGVGGIQNSDNFQVDSYRPYSPKIPDPYADVNPSASDMHCAVPTTVTTTTTTPSGTWHWEGSGSNKGKVDDPPIVTTTTTTVPTALTESTNWANAKAADGTAANCFSSLSVSPGTTLNLGDRHGAPIYINGGDAFIQGNLSCTNCTIVLTNIDMTNPNATIGEFKVNSTANINMTAPAGATDLFKGIAIYQDRRAQTGPSHVNKINGNSGSIIQGALYFPKQKLEYNGTGTTSAICTMFVAWTLEFTGNSTTSNKFKSLADCSAYGLGGGGGATRMVRLVA